MITSDLKARAELWIEQDLDETSKVELREALSRADAADIQDRMAGPLEFGTAGLRGVLGAGPNRMNRAVVCRTSAGLASYLLNTLPDVRERGVVVGFDARRMSQTFAEDTACVLAAHGIPVHLSPSLCPTPIVAFAVRALRASAGVMVTASHNPPEYNGYKVYWNNGAQIIPPHDRGIADAIDQAPVACNVPRLDLHSARTSAMVRDLDPAVIDQYLRSIEALSIHRHGREGMRIVYTPLHGVGDQLARAALAQAGFHDVASVAEQAVPDGEFPTVRFPNPEEPGALDLALALAKSRNADLIIANDPDADRLSVAVPDQTGSFVQLTGNQIGVLLAHYLLTEQKHPPVDRLVVTTIVSSPMLGVIAHALGVRYEEVLTGFKWIANRAMEVEDSTGTVMVAGYEEALGYTLGSAVRDKDGIAAAAIFAEMAAHCRAEGRSVLDELERMYRRFGLFVSSQRNIVHKGVDGAERISDIMSGLRQASPSTIGPFHVVGKRDYLSGTWTSADGVASNLQLPSSNVLAFEIGEGHRVVARPSGTEPKIKFYFDVREPVRESEPFVQAQQRASHTLERLEQAFLGLI